MLFLFCYCFYHSEYSVNCQCDFVRAGKDLGALPQTSPKGYIPLEAHFENAYIGIFLKVFIKLSTESLLPEAQKIGQSPDVFRLFCEWY